MQQQVAAPPAVEVPRDRWGKPLIIPPGGGKPVPYQRASSFGEVLSDQTGLSRWKTRMAVKGLTLRPDLFLAASATPLEAKFKLDSIAQEACDHADTRKAASIGTSLHSFTEMIDRGEELPAVPAAYEADLAAYMDATSRFEMVHIERFMVCDELQVAGTPDRVMRELDVTEGNVHYIANDKLVIGDLKTGTSSAFLDKHAVQLAIYSRSVFYDPATGRREPIGDVEQGYAWLYHLPAGEGRCDLFTLDIEAGWEGALLAADVRAWRKRKGLLAAA